MNERIVHKISPKAGAAERWERWKRFARRIRVPLGFVTAAVYLFEVVRRAPHPTAIAWSLLLVVPGVALRAAASGTVKKNQELCVTGPYAHTRNPLYLGSTLIAAGFAVALLSWPLALLLAAGFAAIYVPVIASEEQFLRGAFPEFDSYCASVPRFIPRLTPARPSRAGGEATASQAVNQAATGGFSFALYLKHREYNSALGAALLYLSLLYLRPLLEPFLHRAW
ncbi:MAG TPA: isoprenylcysteine carboxylmethyltransferase family protein [Terracidiphilus sp.]|jgi:protein-S-isoprenylcysteine O-methyltransferase Ste14